ncbi:MAG TPA: hypothetical protein VF808_07000 [Ktedonobacterales bacterium]
MSSVGNIAKRPETGPIDEMTIEELRLLVQRLESENAAMRPITLRVAEARMCREATTMVESCPHCSLRRGATLGYSGVHDENCVVSQARRLGF